MCVWLHPPLTHSHTYTHTHTLTHMHACYCSGGVDIRLETETGQDAADGEEGEIVIGGAQVALVSATTATRQHTQRVS
jgi:hypothetical protein